ncbi:MAG: hypothetical protein ABIJ59_02410 [Pseudomonadota bacterium]
MSQIKQPWEMLSELIAEKNSKKVTQFISDLSHSETARAISRLTDADQTHLFNLLSPVDS